jgi:hypothetical protein
LTSTVVDVPQTSALAPHVRRGQSLAPAFELRCSRGLTQLCAAMSYVWLTLIMGAAWILPAQQHPAPVEVFDRGLTDAPLCEQLCIVLALIGG